MHQNTIKTLISSIVLIGATAYFILFLDLRTELRSFKLGLDSGEIQLLSFVIGITLCCITGFALSRNTTEKNTTRISTNLGMTMSIFLLLYWFIPMTGTGIMGANWYNIPVAVRNQYRISCLFTHSSRSWPTAHFEVRKFGEMTWTEGPLKGYFDLDIFGYRSRFNRVLSASKGKYKEGKSKGKLYPSNRRRLQEMSEYIATTWAINNPEDAPVVKVRLSLANHPVGKEHCMAREPWSRPPLSEIPKKYISEVGVFNLDVEKKSESSIKNVLRPFENVKKDKSTNPKLNESPIILPSNANKSDVKASEDIEHD